MIPRLISFLLLVHLVASFKYLVFNPQIFKSHATHIGKIADILVEEGHDVVVVSSKTDGTVGTPGAKKARVIELSQCAKAKAAEEWQFGPGGMIHNAWLKEDPTILFLTFDILFEAYAAQCNATLHTPGLLDMLRAEKFDAACAETMDLCGFGIIHMLGIKKFAVCQSLPAINQDFTTHMPYTVSYVPGLLATVGEKMSFFERARNGISTLLGRWCVTRNLPHWQKVFNEFEPGFPALEEVVANASLVFVNTEPLTDFPRPVAARIIDYGGIAVSVNPSGHLEEQWSDVLNLRPQTVLISFGTFVKSFLMPQAYKTNIRKTLEKFPNVTFIWHYDKPEEKVSGNASNIIETTWMPQVDLLSDPRLTAFITHGGLASVFEVVQVGGLPLLCIPVSADHKRTSAGVKRNGFGIVMDKTALGVEGPLEAAITELLERSGELREQARKISKMVNERPFTMREQFVRNMEFLVKHGPLRNLDHHGRHLNIFQYFMIDVIFVALSIIVIALAIVILITKYVLKSLLTLLRSSKTKKE